MPRHPLGERRLPRQGVTRGYGADTVRRMRLRPRETLREYLRFRAVILGLSACVLSVAVGVERLDGGGRTGWWLLVIGALPLVIIAVVVVVGAAQYVQGLRRDEARHGRPGRWWRDWWSG